MKKYLVFFFATIAFSGFTDQVVPLTMSFTLQATGQQQNGSDNGTTTIYSTSKQSITSKTILTALAEAEFNEDNFPTNKFPSGAKLVFMNDKNDLNSSYFIIEDKSGNQICDVSDIIQFQETGEHLILSGKISDSTGLFNKVQENYLGTLYYDDTGAGGTTAIYLTGLIQVTANDSAPSSGTYTETITAKSDTANGEGAIAGTNTVVSGSVSASGKGTLVLP